MISDRTIWFEIFPSRIPKIALLIGVIGVAAGVFLFSGYKKSCDIFDWIPNVRVMASQSSMPLAMVIAYGGALVIAPIIAIITCFSEVKTIQPFQRLLRARSGVSRIIMAAGMMMIVMAPHVLPLHPNMSVRFFDAIKTNELILLYWAEGILMVNYFLLLLLALELRNLIYYTIGK